MLKPALTVAVILLCSGALGGERGHAGQLDPALDGIGSSACRYAVINYWGLGATSETLPCGSYARVLNLANNLSVTVKIIDVNPSGDGVVMDLTPGAADAIDAKERTEVLILPLKERR